MTSVALNQTINPKDEGALSAFLSWLRTRRSRTSPVDVKPEDQQALLLEMMLSNPEAFRTESDFCTMAHWVPDRGW